MDEEYVDYDEDDDLGTYLGDSVTASFDGWHIVLKANGGQHTIYLDPSTYAALVHYAEANGIHLV